MKKIYIFFIFFSLRLLHAENNKEHFLGLLEDYKDMVNTRLEASSWIIWLLENQEIYENEKAWINHWKVYEKNNYHSKILWEGPLPAGKYSFTWKGYSKNSSKKIQKEIEILAGESLKEIKWSF